jgi:hypothetical protein
VVDSRFGGKRSQQRRLDVNARKRRLVSVGSGEWAQNGCQTACASISKQIHIAVFFFSSHHTVGLRRLTLTVY